MTPRGLAVETRLRNDGIDPRFFDRRLMELRMTGMSYADIARAVSFYEGWHNFSDQQIRERLNRLGAPKNPRKVEASRKSNRARAGVPA